MEKRGVLLLLFSFVLVALLFGIQATEGRVVHQTVNSGNGLKFLAKFCFSKGKGNVTFQSWHKGSSPTSDVLLLGFDDESSSWPAVYGTGMSCNEQRQRAKWFWPVGDNQIEKITTDDHVEPRYWYIALSRCTGGDYELEFRTEFLQGGGFWEDQFSYEKWALMGLYMGLFIAYFLMLVIQIRIVIYRISHGELSHLHRLFTLIVIVYEVSFLSSFIHNAVYAGDGIGAPGLDGFGEIMEICGEILFVGLVLVMARGWLVTTTELRGKKTLIAIFSVFLITYIAFFIWENVGVDLETNNNVYESVPGIINLVVRFIIWIFFAFYIVTSLLTKDKGAEYFYEQGAIEVKWEPEQRRTPFFVLFGLLITNWFLILPFFVLVSLGAPEYNRVKVIEYIYYIATFLTHCVFVAWFFFKQHGPVEGGSSILGGLSQDDRVHTSNALDAPATLPSSNPFVSSFSNFRDESAPIRGSKGIELKTRDSKKENSTFEKEGEKENNSGLYDNL